VGPAERVQVPWLTNVHAEMIKQSTSFGEAQRPATKIHGENKPSGTGKDASTAIFARPHLDGSGLRMAQVPLSFVEEFRKQQTNKSTLAANFEAPSGPRRWRRRESCCLMFWTFEIF